MWAQASTGFAEEDLPPDVSAALEAEQNYSCASGRSAGSCLPDAEAGLRSPSPEECSAHGAIPHACQQLVCTLCTRKVQHALAHARVPFVFKPQPSYGQKQIVTGTARMHAEVPLSGGVPQQALLNRCAFLLCYNN